VDAEAAVARRLHGIVGEGRTREVATDTLQSLAVAAVDGVTQTPHLLLKLNLYGHSAMARLVHLRRAWLPFLSHAAVGSEKSSRADSQG